MLGLKYFKSNRKKSTRTEEAQADLNSSPSPPSTNQITPNSSPSDTPDHPRAESTKSKRSSLSSRFRRHSTTKDDELPPPTPLPKSRPVSDLSSASALGSHSNTTSYVVPVEATPPPPVPTRSPIQPSESVPSTPSTNFSRPISQPASVSSHHQDQNRRLSRDSDTLPKQEPPVAIITPQRQISTSSPSRYSIASDTSSTVSVISNTPTPIRRNQVQSSVMMSPRISSSGFSSSNGNMNGISSPPMSPMYPMSPMSPRAFRNQGRIGSFASSLSTSGTFGMKAPSRRSGGGGGGYKIGLVQESAEFLRRRSMNELGAGVSQGIVNVSYVNFLEWIRSERLTTLPHKGSRWDKVLIRALYFAEQLNIFNNAIQGYAVDSSAAAAIGYGHARLLLELGHDNSAALDRAFSVLYKFSLSFSSVLRRSELLAATPEIREQLCLLFTDLLTLVVDVSIKFYKTVNGMTSGSTSLDIYEHFGENIEGFRTRQQTVAELIWESQIDGGDYEEGEGVDIQTLNRWLTPQDRVLATLNRDHSILVDQQVEMTCLWFQKHLSRFVQSDKTFMLVTGQPGTGKTTLAGSIAERLQRPLNRKQVDTLFCSLSPDVPTSATSLAVVKSLLSQLLNTRIGNLAMYNALFRAYHQCRTATDLKTYEEYLWQALAETLNQPHEGGNDLIMIVDGLDEIESSQSASIQAAGGFSSAALLEKLVSSTNKRQGVRLVMLATPSVKMPSGVNGIQHHITRDNIREDLHTVALRALVHNHHFHSKSGNEQETMLDRIIQSANGSFLWTTLVCEILNAQKSPDAVTKTLESLESSRPSEQDLVLKVFGLVDQTENTKKLLSWVLAAERPLTTEEIHVLFTIDVQRGTVSDTGINVHETLQKLKPLLTLSEHIVRFRHPIVHSALHDLANANKIPIPLKESETDLLLRVLTYTKYTLRDKGEPSLENDDPKVSDKLFRQNRFLEYCVRYWVEHLQQSPLALKSSTEYKPTAELKKAMPDSTTMPILEQLVWSTQLPLPEAIDLHVVVGNVRRGIFTENHPTVLQTYISLATTYHLLSNPDKAATYFYLCSKISRTVFSDIHPLTLECANHFLKITELLTTTTRTEVMIHREEILILLINAYERQYGSTSELVIQTRKQLVELYVLLNEEDKVIELYRIIQEATISAYGRNSHQAQDIEGRLGVVLGKGRGVRRIDSYKESFFEHHDHEDSTEVFDLGSIALYLQNIQEYISRKDHAHAERTFVELWQEVSSRCRTTQSVEWHEKNIEVATSYAQYLKTQKRMTEASSILTCIWQQYESHQLSFAESIVSRLTNVAKEMKSIGNYTSALSIFKHASSFYKNSRQEDSHASREISNHVSETSTELVRQSLASSDSSETTTTVSESVFKDVFFSIIKSSKTLDASTVALSKKLTIQHIEERNWYAAIDVIQATLQRTWPTFMSSSIHNVTMTSTFTQESIELVERLAECYQQTKQMEKVEDTYSRFFRAALVTQNVDKAVFEKAKHLLINYYDKHGYQDNAISVYQDILVTYRTRLGPTHELTIQTLYILAHRCQQHPRNHPYWIEYYLQIITSLNKDSDVCHKDALDAIVVVTNTYWQDRRYAEAVTIYAVLWNTFVRQTKQHKIFSDEKFVQNLYEHYFQCLEETKASFESLYKVTKEYREVATATFGADSHIATEATLSLAQVSQRSEQHISQAISLYEEVSRSTKTTTTTTRTRDLKQALSSLYVRQMKSDSSSNFKSEHFDRALSMTQEQLSDSTSKYGYSHESSLSHVKELAMLYQRQQKSDAAVKTLTTAVSEIISKETSSQKQIEAAASLAASFHACQQTATAHKLVQELHRQICAKDTRYASQWSFDVTKTTRSALAFLASFQYHMRQDLNVTFAEIMASLTMEYIYFEQFRLTLQNNESLTSILQAGAPLRYFLRQNDQQEMVTVVEDQASSIFIKRDAQDLHTLSKESPRIFIVGILDQLGSGRNKDFNRSVILASNDSVSKLTKAKKFSEAYDIAHLGFLFASKHDGYNGPRAIGLGFKLASLLVGRDGDKATDAALRKKMLDLSNKIVRRILEICKNLNINFAQVQLYELSNLSALLGEQNDYATLEWLLATLWQTRDAQRAWPSEVLLNLGRRLICARYLAGSPVKAIRLAEDIAYNMRRAHGPRAPVTIETYELLAQLYTSTGLEYQSKATPDKANPLAQEYFKKAVGVHEDILRLMVNNHGAEEDSDDELDTAAYLLAKEGVSVKSQSTEHTESLDADNIDKSAIALRHLRLLKLAYQRFGAWPKPYDEYEQLNASLFRTYGGQANWKGVEGTEKWTAKQFGAGKAEAQDGAFQGINDWSFGSNKLLLSAQDQAQAGMQAGMQGMQNGFGVEKMRGQQAVVA